MGGAGFLVIRAACILTSVHSQRWHQKKAFFFSFGGNEAIAWLKPQSGLAGTTTEGLNWAEQNLGSLLLLSWTLSSGPSAALESPLPSQISYPKSKKSTKEIPLPWPCETSQLQAEQEPDLPAPCSHICKGNLRILFQKCSRSSSPLPALLLHKRNEANLQNFSSHWTLSSFEENHVLLPHDPCVCYLKLSSRLALRAPKDHPGWLGGRGTFRLLRSKDSTDDTVNNVAAIEMTWQDSKIYFMVYLNTFVSETMLRSLSVQFNLFLPFLLSQEMFKEIYVAVRKSELLISDTEKEITVRKRCRWHSAVPKNEMALQWLSLWGQRDRCYFLCFILSVFLTTIWIWLEEKKKGKKQDRLAASLWKCNIWVWNFPGQRTYRNVCEAVIRHDISRYHELQAAQKQRSVAQLPLVTRGQQSKMLFPLVAALSSTALEPHISPLTLNSQHKWKGEERSEERSWEHGMNSYTKMFSGLRAPPLSKVFLTLNHDFFSCVRDASEMVNSCMVSPPPPL